jgi:transcriptional regulator with XRE-family HTH domain
MDKRRELGQFLKSRRGRLQPDDVGVQTYGRRRVPGLRRSELAQLAGVSVDYYVRLEQGRAGQPSEAVLDAIARALGLDDAERAHVYDLAPRGAGGASRDPSASAPRSNACSTCSPASQHW